MPQTGPNMQKKSVDYLDRLALSTGCARWVVLACNTVACNTFGHDARIVENPVLKAAAREDRRV